MGTHLLEAADETGLILDLLHLVLCPDDDVPDALAGDARVLRDLGEGEVVVVVEVEELLLPVGEELAVEIEEHGHAVGLILQGLPSRLKSL